MRTIRQEKVAVLREGYFKITGNVTEAMLLNQMIYWSQRVSDYDQFISEENARRKIEEQDAINLTYGWIHKTATELKDEIMSDDSRMTIQRKIDNLVKKGYLERRNNPIHAYDRTYQYRVNMLKIYDDLNSCGYQLEGIKIDDDTPHTGDKLTNAQNEQCNEQAEQSNAQNEQWKEHHEQWNAHSERAIPETTTEITTETSSSSYSPIAKNPTKGKDDDDKKGEVSKIIDDIGLNKIQHKDMTHPISELISDLMLTGKVGKKRYSQTEIKKSLSLLRPSDIDSIIDRYTETAAKGEIANPENFLKTCFLSAGRALELKSYAIKSGAEGVDCGNPSFDVEEFVKMSMQSLYEEM
jgi:hypothetical protein